MHYTAYTLHIVSELMLPELEPVSEGAADVQIHFGQICWSPPPGDHQEGYVTGDCHEAYVHVEGVGSFAISAGREIIIDPAPGVAEATLRVFLLGAALGLLLYQRGWLVLHASAMSLDGAGVIFLGQSGAGKSTLAAALHARGYQVVADDVTAVDVLAPGGPLLLPGFARLKVWPAVATVLGHDPALLPIFEASDERREYGSNAAFPPTPLPLRHIYLLDSGRRTHFERLDRQETFAVLMANSYAVGLLGSQAATPAHFQQCIGVAAGVAAYRLRRRRWLAGLPKLAALVAAHNQEETVSNATL